MNSKLTEGHLFQLIQDRDQRVRSRTTAKRLAMNQFEEWYAQIEHRSAESKQDSAQLMQDPQARLPGDRPNDRRALTRRSSRPLADALGVTVSFYERARFIIDHGTDRIRSDLVHDRITFREAHRLSCEEREVRRLGLHTGPSASVGEQIATFTRKSGMIRCADLTTHEHYRELIDQLAALLVEKGTITSTEQRAIMRGFDRG